MTLDAILDEIRTLPIVERKRLISLIEETLNENLPQRQPHSILEFEGIAAHLADHEDLQAANSGHLTVYDLLAMPEEESQAVMAKAFALAAQEEFETFEALDDADFNDAPVSPPRAT